MNKLFITEIWRFLKLAKCRKLCNSLLLQILVLKIYKNRKSAEVSVRKASEWNLSWCFRTFHLSIIEPLSALLYVLLYFRCIALSDHGRFLAHLNRTWAGKFIDIDCSRSPRVKFPIWSRGFSDFNARELQWKNNTDFFPEITTSPPRDINPWAPRVCTSKAIKYGGKRAWSRKSGLVVT